MFSEKGPDQDGNEFYIDGQGKGDGGKIEFAAFEQIEEQYYEEYHDTFKVNIAHQFKDNEGVENVPGGLAYVEVKEFKGFGQENDRSQFKQEKLKL